MTLLGIDVGTGGAKAILIDDAGAVLAAVTTEYPLHTPRPRWSEQDPEDWWQATCTSIGKTLKQAGRTAADVRAVGLTGQMHGLVLLDADGAVLRPAMLWNDQRTAAECDEIHRRIGVERVIAITGKPALTGFTAPKILWLEQHEPGVHAAARTMLLPKDYVRFRLTGARVMDVADASGTTLFDVTRRAWSDEMTNALGVPTAWLPEVTESPEVSAHVSADGAAASGLTTGTPVVTGAGDQAAEAIGCGIARPGHISVTVGTSGVVFAATETPRIDRQGRLHAYCHALPDRWHFMGVMLSAGGSFRWFRDTLGGDAGSVADTRGVDPYDVLVEEAGAAAPGCEGLTFLPYLTGERTPYADPHAQGAFVGLSLRTHRSHLVRAVLEGITFGLRDSLELVKELGLPIDAVRISGGGARAPFWRQMMADVFAMPVATVNATQGAAFGAALLAGVGVGVWSDVERAADAVVRETSVTQPSGTSYDDAYARYRALYPALRSWWTPGGNASRPAAV